MYLEELCEFWSWVLIKSRPEKPKEKDRMGRPQPSDKPWKNRLLRFPYYIPSMLTRVGFWKRF